MPRRRSDRAARQRLMEVARLGARMQRERTVEAVLEAASRGLESLDLASLVARPQGDVLRVERPRLAGELAERIERALGVPLAGLKMPWLPACAHAWREGMAYAGDLPAAAAAALGEPGQAVRRALRAGGLARAIAVRVGLCGEPHALLVAMGSWLRQEDLPAFQVFGAQISAALDAACSIRDLSARNAELAALNRLAEAGGDAPDLQAFLRRGAEEVVRSLGCDAVAVWLLDESRQELEMAFEFGAAPEERPDFAPVAVAGSCMGEVVTGSDPRVIQWDEYPAGQQPLVGKAGCRTHASVPLRLRGRPVGVMNVAWREHRDRGGANLPLLLAMAGPFAAAVEAQRLLGTLRGRVSELTLLNELAVASANLNSVYLLETALRRVLATLRSEAGAAYLVDGSELVRVASIGVSEETLRLAGRHPLLSDASEAGASVRRMSPVLIPRLADGSHHARLLHQREGLQAAVAVPIAVKRQALGAFLIARRRAEPYRPEEVELLSALMAQLGVAVENARVFADTQRRVSDLEAVNQLSLSVFGSGPGDTQALLGTAAAEIGRELSARSVAVLLLDEPKAALRSAAGWGMPLPAEPVVIPLKSGTLATQALELQVPVWSADTSVDPRSAMRGVMQAPPMSMLIVPLTSRRAPRGVVAIAAEPGRRFGEAEVALAFALASTAAMGLYNAELYGEARRRAEEQGLLLEVGRSLVATLDLAQVLDAGVANLARIVGAPDAYLFLVDATGKELEMRAAAGTFPELVGSRVPVEPPQDSLGSLVFHRREPLVLEDGASHPSLHPEVLGLHRGSAYLGLPLVVRDRTIGAALIADPRGPRRFSPAEVERAAAIANQLAVAAENARLYDDLRRSYAELGQAQARLVQRERLAALGELSAVVAHEVRNPLGVIFNSLGSLRRLLKPEGDARMLLDIVGEEADRLNRIVGDLLDFARPSTPALRPEALDRLLDEAVGAAVAENRAVAVERDVASDLPLVSLDARLMRQALLNVAVNAVQAMPRGGTLTLRARRDGGWARVEIRDTGSGIPDEIRHRIFEPFFTTKASGTGLGLAVVKRIVEGHGGEVAVASAAGVGAAFTIRIPLEA